MRIESPFLEGAGSPRHSRSASHYCETLERILRGLKTQSGKLHRHLDYATSFLDALRLLALLTGLISENEGMLPVEYLVACRATLEECDRFANVLSSLLQTDQTAVNWYRVAKASELSLPRAYLLLTLGRTYLSLDDLSFSRLFVGCERIKSKGELIDDVRIGCLAVGEPVKGLALHAALMRQIEPFLFHETADWCLSRDDTIETLLEEFSVTNRLWVRMRFTVGESDNMERRQLEEIVSYPIRLLSQVPGLGVEAYSKTVLPVLLQHLTGCRDELAQEYLTESILNSFSVNFHLQTAEQLLDAVSKYSMAVDIRRLISLIISRILQSDSDSEFESDSESGSKNSVLVFEMLWERIAGLLLHRIETSRAEEAIMLCVPLLNRALEMVPFVSERVEKILEFVELSSRQAAAYPDSSSTKLLVGKIVDSVLELVPNASSLFEMPSLFGLLNELTQESRSSCSLSFIGRLVRDRLTIDTTEQLEYLSVAVELITTTDQTPAELDSLVNYVNVLEYAADSVYNSLLIFKDTIAMFENGKKMLSSVSNNGQVLPMLIFTQKAINAWLVAKIEPKDIKIVLAELHRNVNGKQITLAISRPQFESAALEYQRQLALFMYDSVSVAVVQIWARCVEKWRGKCGNDDEGKSDHIGHSGHSGNNTPNTPNDKSDLIYDCLVEMLMIFEENVTDHYAQCSILSTIIHQLDDSARILKKSDISVLVSKLHVYGKRLLKIDERRLMLQQVLGLSVKLGAQVELETVVRIAETMQQLLPADTKTEALLIEIVQFNKLLMDYMAVTEPSSVLGKIVYSYFSTIETQISQLPIESASLRRDLDKALEEWTRLGTILRPEYETEDPLIEALCLDASDGRDCDQGAFSTFNPDLAEF